MRVKKTVFLILGTLSILFNLVAYIGGASPFSEDQLVDNTVNNVAYFIGINFFFIVGFVFLFISYRLNKKIYRKKRQQMLDSLLTTKNETVDEQQSKS